MSALNLIFACFIAFAAFPNEAGAQQPQIVPGQIIGGEVLTQEMGSANHSEAAVRVACDDGWLLRGIAFRAGDWTANVRALCTPYLPFGPTAFPLQAKAHDGYLHSFKHGPAAGGNGGSLIGAALCGDRYFVSGLKGWVATKSSSVYVAQAGVICTKDTLDYFGEVIPPGDTPPFPNVVSITSAGTNGNGAFYAFDDSSVKYTLHEGEVSSLDDGPTQPALACPLTGGGGVPNSQTWVAKGVFVRLGHNNDITSIGLICTQIKPYSPINPDLYTTAAGKALVTPVPVATMPSCETCNYMLNGQKKSCAVPAGPVGASCSCGLSAVAGSPPMKLIGKMCLPGGP